MVTRLLGYLLLACAALLVAWVFFVNSGKNDQSLIFSPTQLLNSTWASYKKDFLEPDTFRTLDTTRNNITTSEGQSYTMLRAVWVGDRETFDGAWEWTRVNLGRDDHLFSWLWGKEHNSASDADTDIAVALLFAYGRWQEPTYLVEAKNIMNDIWDKEVVVRKGVYYLAADDVEKNTKGTIVVNPSYYHPAAYKLFALVDKPHSWTKLVDSSYQTLAKSMELSFGLPQSAGVPPDWVGVTKDGSLVALASSTLDTNFSYDALRLPWRIALDYAWFADPRDVMLLKKMSYLSEVWQKEHKLASVYTHDGNIVDPAEVPAMYGGTIGYFMVADPLLARDVYTEKLAFLYNPGAETWKTPLTYYDDNWAWFGIALYNNVLPNLYEK